VLQDTATPGGGGFVRPFAGICAPAQDRSAPPGRHPGRNKQVDRRMNHAFFVTERQTAATDAYCARPAAKLSAESGVKDTAAVDVRNWHSMQYWAKWLGISEQQLIRATRIAGTNVALIEAHLAERRARRQRKRMRIVEPA
jgi:hypothetical protein